MTIVTVGYEGLSIAVFLSLLARNAIETVIDIRELPLSRKPGFSKKALASALEENGIEYVHMNSLGCPKPVRDRYRADGDWRRYTVGFLEHLGTQQAAIADLSDKAAHSKCALLCFEADYTRCHRSLVANAVREHCGADIVHLKAKTGIPEQFSISKKQLKKQLAHGTLFNA